MALLLFFVFLLASTTNYATATTDLQAFIYKTCSNNQTLQKQTTNLTLNILFTKLVSQSSTTNFFQTTVTHITGLYQCRSDLSHTKCHTCVQTLTNTIQTSCYTARAQLLGCYMWPTAAVLLVVMFIFRSVILVPDGGDDDGGNTGGLVALLVAAVASVLLQS
uniref:Gnk2-homologous domain-containing protein n=1 Tax=Tanacetum cinerariifolium TaxID=118510 RepID=A0A699HP42_TANCI|nr:hypothetical protein [Tanacetum cinerariifolium]